MIRGQIGRDSEANTYLWQASCDGAALSTKRVVRAEHVGMAISSGILRRGGLDCRPGAARRRRAPESAEHGRASSDATRGIDASAGRERPNAPAGATWIVSLKRACSDVRWPVPDSPWRSDGTATVARGPRGSGGGGDPHGRVAGRHTSRRVDRAATLNHDRGEVAWDDREPADELGVNRRFWRSRRNSPTGDKGRGWIGASRPAARPTQSSSGTLVCSCAAVVRVMRASVRVPQGFTRRSRRSHGAPRRLARLDML
jgi:hypothetical protein